MKTLIIQVYCALFLAVAVQAAPVKQSSFRYTAEVKGDFAAETPVRLTLSEQVISKSSPEFLDLRIFDDEGMETPYVIYKEVVPGEKETSFVFKVRSFDEQAEKVEVILECLDKEKTYDRIDISTPARDFKRKVEVYTSNNSGDELPNTWQKAASDMVFDFSSQIDLRKTDVGIGTTSSRYLKLVLISEEEHREDGGSMDLSYDGLQFEVKGLNLEPFRIDRVTARGGKRRTGEPVLDRKIISRPRHKENNMGDSIYELGPVNLPFTKVTLSVDRTYFHRRVELMGADADVEEEYVQFGSGTVYNIPGMEKPSSTFSAASNRYRFVRLRIVNRDNPPLDIRKLVLAWPRANLYFIPEKGKSYTLFFGGKEITRPDYELDMIIKREHKVLSGYAELSLKQVSKNPGFEDKKPVSKKEFTEKAVFKIVIGLLVLGLAFWLYKLMKKLPSPGSGE